ncbi:MAG: radical SAM protein [Ectothiorhodospiraceae bacterium]
MARILLELTNRCNLRCRHCYDERHAATGYMPLGIVDAVLSEGHACGIDYVVFTGGEATLHPEFEAIVRRVAAAGYGYGFVSNAITFPRIYPLLLSERAAFRGVTFSLDGASAVTHDRLRGRGSFRRVLKAATLCVFHDLPFSLNMVVTAENRHEIPAAVDLAGGIGSCGIRFGHLISTQLSPRPELELSLSQRREVETQIAALAQRAPVPVAMGPGYYSESELFPCAPLNLQEFNVDYRGNLTLCCQLSGIAGANVGADLMGNVADLGLTEACERFRAGVAAYVREKRAAAERGELGIADRFACLYCQKYLGNAAPLHAEDASSTGNAGVPCSQ